MRTLEVRATDPSGGETSVPWTLGYSDFDVLVELARWLISLPESSRWELEIRQAGATVRGQFSLERDRPLYRMAHRLCRWIREPILDAECLWFAAIYAVRPALAPLLEPVLFQSVQVGPPAEEIAGLPSTAYASLASLLATSYQLHLVVHGQTSDAGWHLTPSMYLVLPRRSQAEPVWTPILPPECSWSDVVPICMALSPAKHRLLPYQSDTSMLLPGTVDLRWDPRDASQTRILGLEPSALVGLTYWWLHAHRMIRDIVWHDPVHFLLLRYAWLRHPQVRQLVQRCGHDTSVHDLMQAMLLMKHYAVQGGDPVARGSFDEEATALGLSYMERRSLQFLIEECGRIPPELDGLEQELSELVQVLQAAIDAACYLDGRFEEWR